MADSDADRVIAIDVLLLPDTTMVEHAKEANAQLLANYPKGYTLGSEQTATSRWSIDTSTKKTCRKSNLPSREFPNKPCRSIGNSPPTAIATESGPD